MTTATPFDPSEVLKILGRDNLNPGDPAAKPMLKTGAWPRGDDG